MPHERGGVHRNGFTMGSENDCAERKGRSTLRPYRAFLDAVLSFALAGLLLNVQDFLAVNCQL